MGIGQMGAGFQDRGGWWVVGQFVLMAAVAAAGPLWPGDWGGTWLPAATGLGLAGAVVGIAGAVALGRNRTAYPVPKSDGELIRHGIYRHIRHPLYSSLVLLGCAWGVWWESPLAVGATAMMGLLLNAKAASEERRLRIMFSDYAAYARQVPRFVPRPWGRTRKDLDDPN